MVSWCSTILENPCPLLFQTFLFQSFFLLSLSQYCICYTFWNCPAVIGHSGFLLVFIIFSLHFWLRCFYWPRRSSKILSSAMSSLLRSPSKAHFISVTLFLIFSVFFHFFLDLPSLLYYLSAFAYWLLFSIKTISIFIRLKLIFSLIEFQYLCHIRVWVWWLLYLFRLFLLAFWHVL